MASSLNKLISIAGPALGGSVDDASAAPGGRLGQEILGLLRQRNGFYAFEAALHFFPMGDVIGEYSLQNWNSPELWKCEYHGTADGICCFAEDIFGAQFVISGDAICSFDPETGGLAVLARSMEDFANVLLGDYRVLTGQPIAHQWQSAHGRLESGLRLCPKLPFVLGGEFSVANLVEIDMVRGMKARANLAVQIRDLPDGAKVTYKLID